MDKEPTGKSDVRELIERASYMERILEHTIEGIRLDTKSLESMAKALDPPYHSGNSVHSSPTDTEGLAINDEACTMDPVGETTTRLSCPCLVC